MKGAKSVSRLIFLHVDAQYHLLRKLPFVPLYWLSLFVWLVGQLVWFGFVKDQLTVFMAVYFRVLYFVL